ncbi:MAG: GNAT family N-acetyltransferase [Proteobacteria bacterium]|nr:GNAT family N-acetyltransferase [Pseudomonadota bacterium]
MQIKLEFISKDVQKSAYNWVNISFNGDLVGKSRCKILYEKITIFSINIYPEFEEKGFGKEFIDILKEMFDAIIADRVRYTAIGFWEKMGFSRQGEDNYSWHK